MALNPLRRRSKLASAAKAARNAAIADAAWALARDRLASKVPGVDSRRRGPSRKLLLLGGAATIVAAGVLVKRDRARALLPGGSSASESYSPPPPPQPSNYDAPGPAANTATPIPAPDPVVRPDPVQDALAAEAEGLAYGDLIAAETAVEEAAADAPPAIDEAAEEEAAAAEAAAIGGSTSDYAGSEPGFSASEADRPLAEAGEGEAEGQEQAEAGLVENASSHEAGMTDAERQIEDVIEQADNPAVGETPESLVSEADSDDDQGGSSDWQTWSGGAVKPE
jgi:hypothetical protein